MTSEQQPSDRDRQESTAEDSESSAGGRIRESIGAARQAIGRGFDQVTGTEFRRQFDEFTSVVSSAILGVHQDQAELRERLERLEQRSERPRDPQLGSRKFVSLNPPSFDYGRRTCTRLGAALRPTGCSGAGPKEY